MLTALLVVVACGGGAKEAPPQAAKAKEQVGAPGEEGGQTPAPPPTADHMKVHFEKATKARDAVVAGDMVALKEPTTWLAEHETDPRLPEAWGPFIADMKNAAKRGAAATDLAGAADAVAHMAAACGSCHQGMGKALPFTGKSPDGQESSALAHMLRHQWAVERLWEGLVGPSEPAWTSGIAALDEAPLHPEMIEVEGAKKSPPPEVVALGTRVHELAASGKEARDPAARATVYAGLIATCAACHQALGK